MKNFSATNWEEYSSQGPDFQKISDWWKTNWKSVDGKNDSYSAWKFWYKNAYNDIWDKTHKGPVDALKTLQDVAKEGVSSYLEKRKTDRDERKNFIGSLTGAAVRGVLDKNLVDVKSNRVHFDGINTILFSIANDAGLIAKQMGLPKPMITSAVRLPIEQARAMANNWTKNGGKDSGKDYLVGLYGDDEMAINVHNIFASKGTGKDGVSAVAQYIKTEKPNASPHLSGRSLDFRMTSGIESVLSAVKKSGKYSFKMINEGDHIHIQVSA